MAHQLVILCAYVFFQGALGKPATVGTGTTNSASYGTQFQSDFNKNLAAAMNNMYSGTTNMVTPPIKLGLDTIPNLIQYGIHTATDKVNKLATAGKEGFGKIGVGLGHAVGGGTVLGSSAIGGAMQLLGHGLGAGVNVADAGAKAGVDILGKVGDNTASGITVSSTIANDALTTLGNSMVAAGTGVNVVSSGLSSLLDAIGMRLALGINKAEQIVAGLLDAGVLKLENGALSFSSSAQANVYNILNSFLQILVNVQKMFDSMKVNINAGVNTSGTANTGSGTTVSGSTVASTPTVSGSRSAISEAGIKTGASFGNTKLNINAGVNTSGSANTGTDTSVSGSTAASSSVSGSRSAVSEAAVKSGASASRSLEDSEPQDLETKDSETE